VDPVCEVLREGIQNRIDTVELGEQLVGDTNDGTVGRYWVKICPNVASPVWDSSVMSAWIPGYNLAPKMPIHISTPDIPSLNEVLRSLELFLELTRRDPTTQ